ncbi:MAG: nucleoside-diphosphate sugar epimerase, partial [Negativicutes bacterium]|nr:nucleoside-diphosphate sugar epimerase [Negativicutes bacterium]
MAGAGDGFNVFNIGTDEYCTVEQSARWICQQLGLTPQFNFSGGRQGWVGDNPFIWLDCRRIRSLGWRPQLTIRQAIERTVEYLTANRWLLTDGR